MSDIIYTTHENGGRPLRVLVNGQHVTIWRKKTCLIERKYAEVHVGKSPMCEMTKFSGGHGPEFDGNTLLLRLETDGLDYDFVQSAVYKFTAKSPIVRFVSPVGNNDVPYPFAIDNAGRVYLFIEKVIIAGFTGNDPYGFYYKSKPNTMPLVMNTERMIVSR